MSVKGDFPNIPLVTLNIPPHPIYLIPLCHSFVSLRKIITVKSLLIILNPPKYKNDHNN